MDNFDYEIEASGTFSKNEEEIEIDFSEALRKKESLPEDKAEPSFDTVEYSARIIEALSDKAKRYNKKNKTRVTADQLREVYKNGFEIFSDTDVWQVQFPEKNNGEWAMARVNMFLRMRLGDKRQGPSQRINSNRFLDISASWCPIDEDFASAREDIKEYNLSEKIDSIDELYLDGYQKEMFDWEK